MFRRWRRIDQPGLELAHITVEPRGIIVSSTVIDGGDHPYSLRYIWSLDTAWRTRGLRIEHMNGVDRWLTIERTGEASWRLDKEPAAHLEGCVELDLSSTPFCNTLAMKHLARDGALTAAYISGADLSVVPSRQRYEKVSDTHWRYYDLGIAAGYSADLMVDEDGLIRTYEGLFEAIDDPPMS